MILMGISKIPLCDDNTTYMPGDLIAVYNTETNTLVVSDDCRIYTEINYKDISDCYSFVEMSSNSESMLRLLGYIKC